MNLINAYGPAECSIMVTAHTHLSLDSEILFGRSTGTAATWVVDPNDHEKLAPFGVAGEPIVEDQLWIMDISSDQSILPHISVNRLAG